MDFADETQLLPGERKGIFNFEDDSQDDSITRLWQLNGICPKGTIPIRRDQNESNVVRYAKKKHKHIPQLSLVDLKLVSNSNLEVTQTIENFIVNSM